MRANENPSQAHRHSHTSAAALSFDGHSAGSPSLEHDCDVNCLYCWGPETD